MTKKDFFKSSFVLLGAGLMGFASCTNEDENSVTPDGKGLVSVEIRSGINDGRTHLDGLNVEFDSNDELAVWDGVEKRRFKTDAGGSVALFKGEIAENASQLNILYPYSAGQSCASGTITATIPAKQTTTKDSFDPSANLAVATATYTKGQNITCTLENVCGLLKFTIASDAAKAPYDSIKIAGKDNEKIAGEVTITNKQIDAASGNATTVTLGDATNKLEKNSTYYVVLKPGMFNSGLTMTFYNGGAQVDEPMDIANSEGKVEIKPGVILNAKEVKPEKPEPVFSVSGTTKVKFAPGNLWYDTPNNKFYFETNQWDFPTTWNLNHVGHFYWSIDASVAYNKTYSDSGAATGDVFFTNETETTAKSDFTVDNNGTEETGKWRTLSTAEWKYLLAERTLEGTTTACARYAKATVHNVPGLLIIPDGCAVTGSTATVGGVTISNVNVTNVDYGSNKPSDAEWNDKLEKAGCVFLPCAGGRTGSSVTDVGTFGYYWSSSPYSSSKAYYMYFRPGNFFPQDNLNRGYGLTVRLVCASE